VGTLLLGVFVVIAVLLPDEGRGAWGPGDRITFVGSGVLVLAVLALLSRPKVIADRDGVTVVNLTVKRRLEWAEVLRVNLRPGDPWVTLDLTDGTTLAAMGIQPGGGKAQALRSARQLRDLADTLGSGGPPGEGPGGRSRPSDGGPARGGPPHKGSADD
jgi:hypothetical protein